MREGWTLVLSRFGFLLSIFPHFWAKTVAIAACLSLISDTHHRYQPATTELCHTVDKRLSKVVSQKLQERYQQYHTAERLSLPSAGKLPARDATNNRTNFPKKITMHLAYFCSPNFTRWHRTIPCPRRSHTTLPHPTSHPHSHLPFTRTPAL